MRRFQNKRATPQRFDELEARSTVIHLLELQIERRNKAVEDIRRMAAAGVERIRTAARVLEESARSLQSELYAQCILFKIVAEEFERENDSESVDEIRGALLEVVNSTNDIEHHCKALTWLQANFQAGAEATDFAKVLTETAAESSRAAPFDPRTHPCYEQFNQSIWNVHHAGEPARGQEQDEMVMIGSQYGVKNKTCPLSGKPVTELADPVCNKECEHIYEKVAVMQYISNQFRLHPRRQCCCAIPGCRKVLLAANIACDAALKMNIQELRLREKANVQRAPIADFTEEVDSAASAEELLGAA